MVSYGPESGKLAVIVNIIDHNRALIDGPSSVTGVARQSIPLRWLRLTKFTVKIGAGARLKGLKKAFADAKILEKFQSSGLGKRIATTEKKRNLTDFERFQVVSARKKVISFFFKPILLTRESRDLHFWEVLLENSDMLTTRKTKRKLSREDNFKSQ